MFVPAHGQNQTKRTPPVSSSIYIGTRGWDDPAWTGRFYPDDLPSDWRFCYYSNRLRSVIVPGAAWASAGPAPAAQWIEDSDPEFGMVLELPPELSRPVADPRALDAFLARAAPLKTQCVGWLLRLDAADPDAAWLAAVVARLKAMAPVCLDLTGVWHDPAIARVRVAEGAGQCWRPATEPAPAAGGEFLVCLAAEAAPRAQRRLLEDINKWQAGRRAAGLYFEGPNAPAQAEQARVLAELMGV